ncbi:hypothetical protein VT84_17405 [Gemmata sp. SH-PL17]|nr:hypothetical protein VT84_17405 [Gemmata sp. SH-PL17]
MKRLPALEHVPPAEIARRYRTCPDGAEKTRWRIIRRVTHSDQPMSTGRAASSVGLTASWGRTLLKRWNARGPEGLTDGRKDNGSEPLRTSAQQEHLYTALQADPPDGVCGPVPRWPVTCATGGAPRWLPGPVGNGSSGSGSRAGAAPASPLLISWDLPHAPPLAPHWTKGITFLTCLPGQLKSETENRPESKARGPASGGPAKREPGHRSRSKRSLARHEYRSQQCAHRKQTRPRRRARPPEHLGSRAPLRPTDRNRSPQWALGTDRGSVGDSDQYRDGQNHVTGSRKIV